jgi:cobalt/nickel transport system ATP-binding protein
MNVPAVQIEALSYSYPDGSPALREISLTLAHGERVALVGANGAGKSTLLLHLNGILLSGSVTICGLPVVKRNLKAIRQKVGLVFQNPDDQLFCPTIFEDVAFGPRNLQLPEHEVRRRVEAALRAVGLADSGGRSAFHLSIGEKKRAALATVLAMQPEILVLDEPTSNLDPRGRREIIQVLRDLGGTQLIATHNLDLVRALCTRVLVMRAGRIVADGAPRTVLADEEFLKANDLA